MDEERMRLRGRVDRIRELAHEDQGASEWLQAASLAQSVLADTVGGAHPLMATLSTALAKADYSGALAGSRALVVLFEEGVLASPRLAIAHELEMSLVDLAQAQVEGAEKVADGTVRCVRLAIAAFLAGAALEDALRRICEARRIAFDPGNASIAKLQQALYQPSRDVEVISSSENKHISAWGDTRNKADHGKFTEITYAEVLSMVIGVRGFLDKHLP